MIQRAQSLVEQLYSVEGKAEIIRGEIVPVSPAGGLHGIVAARIWRNLYRHQTRHGGGTAFPDNVGFIVDLPLRESFSPDAAWCPCHPDDVTEDFLEGAPSFAVEVRSPGDYTPSGEAALAAKVADYLAAETLVVWDVDVREELIRCYRAGDALTPQIFGAKDIADAEPAVLGWRFPVKRLKR